jgi:hypothetical protein
MISNTGPDLVKEAEAVVEAAVLRSLFEYGICPSQDRVEELIGEFLADPLILEDLFSSKPLL